MLRRVETDERPLHALPHGALAIEPEQAVPAVADSSFDASTLPRDHPKWRSDSLTLSQRAREVIAQLRPVVVRVLTFWDHRLRECTIGGRRFAVDATGSYRLE